MHPALVIMRVLAQLVTMTSLHHRHHPGSFTIAKTMTSLHHRHHPGSFTIATTSLHHRHHPGSFTIAKTIQLVANGSFTMVLLPGSLVLLPGSFTIAKTIQLVANVHIHAHEAAQAHPSRELLR